MERAGRGRPTHLPDDFDLQREWPLSPEIVASGEVFYLWVQISAQMDSPLEMEIT